MRIPQIFTLIPDFYVDPFFQTKGGAVRNEKSLHHEGDTDFSIFFVHPQGFEPWTH